MWLNVPHPPLKYLVHRNEWKDPSRGESHRQHPPARLQKSQKFNEPPFENATFRTAEHTLQRPFGCHSPPLSPASKVDAPDDVVFESSSTSEPRVHLKHKEYRGNRVGRQVYSVGCTVAIVRCPLQCGTIVVGVCSLGRLGACLLNVLYVGGVTFVFCLVASGLPFAAVFMMYVYAVDEIEMERFPVRHCQSA